MKTLYIWNVVALLLVGYARCQQKPEFAENLEKCIVDAEINVCLRHTMEDLRAIMHVGIPELGLDVMDPFRLANLQFMSDGPISITTTFKDVDVRGMSTFVTKDLQIDPQRGLLFLSISIPQLDIRGTYNVTGQIFIVPISGTGPFNTQLYDLDVTAAGHIAPFGEEGSKGLKIQNTKVDFRLETMRIHLDNLFGGQENLLSETVNSFLNANSKLIVTELKPLINEKIEEIVERVFNDAFTQLSADELINQFNKDN